MALVGTTLLFEATLPATTSAFNTSNLTTVSGETILVIAGFNELSGVTDPSADLTITNTGTALTYTRVLFEGTDNSFSRGMVAWTAPVTTGATIQLTFDCAARNVRRFNVWVRSYSGFDTGDFIGETGQDSDTTNAGSTYSFSLTGTTAATSETVAAVLVDGWTSVTEGASWTELNDFGNSGNLGVQVQARSAAINSVAWAATAGNATPLVGIAVEVKADTAGGVTGTSAQTLGSFTSTASGSVNNAPAVLYVKEVGFVTDTTAGTTSAITVAAGGVPIGDYLVVYGACDNTGSAGAATTIAVADNSNNAGSANTYTLQTPQAIADPVGASAGQQGFFVVCPVTRSLDAGDTITVTFGNSTAAKAINCQQFTPSISGNISILASSYARQDNQTGQSVSVAAGANPTMAGQVVCALVAVEGGTADAFTQDTDTTNGTWVTLTRRGSGTTTSGSTLNSVYKITTASGAQTYDHATMLGTSRDHCAAILVLTPPPISGTVAATLAPFTSTATGTVDTSVTGTSAQTLGPFTSTATGVETITGTSATTLAAFTSTATGTETFTGTSAQTLGAFTSAASGTVDTSATGTVATTLAPFTSTAGAVTGTGVIYLGEIGSWNSATPESFPNVAPTTQAVPVGDLIVIMGAVNNYLTGGVVDTGILVVGGAEDFTTLSPPAIADPGAANEGVQTFIAYTLVAVEAFTTAAGIALAFPTATLSSWAIHRFAGASGILASSYAVQNNQTGQAVSVATGTAPTDAGQIVLAAVGVEGDTSDGFTQDTDTTNGTWVTLPRRSAGTGTSGVTLNQAYKITTAAGAQTYDHATMLGTSRDHCAAVLVLEGIVGTVTGTSATTLGAFTSTATGAQTLTGTSAQTLGAFTSTAAGTVANPVTGTSAQTLAPFTSTATGAETFTGTSATTLGPFISTASGSSLSGVSGTSATTLAPFTSTASGNVTGNVTGTSATTLAAFTSTAAGEARYTGTAAVTLGAFTSTATGLQTLTGAAAATLAPFTSTASGTATVFVTGTSATTLAPFTANTAAALIITGTAAVTLEPFIGYGIEEVFIPAPTEPRITSRAPGRIRSEASGRIRSRSPGLITSGV